MGRDRPGTGRMRSPLRICDRGKKQEPHDAPLRPGTQPGGSAMAGLWLAGKEPTDLYRRASVMEPGTGGLLKLDFVAASHFLVQL